MTMPTYRAGEERPWWQQPMEVGAFYAELPALDLQALEIRIAPGSAR